MSVENVVLLNKEKMITAQEWAKAIKAGGFDAELEIDFDPLTVDGFVKCSYKGKKGGFECYFDEIDISELDASDLKIVGDRKNAIVLITYNDYCQYITSVIAAGVLCEKVDGLMLDGGEMPFILSDESVKWVKDCEIEIAANL